MVSISVSKCARHTPPLGEDVTEQLQIIEREGVAALRARWQELFGGLAPTVFGPDLLRRSIAQYLQQELYGGMDGTIARELNALVRQFARKSPKHSKGQRHLGAGTAMIRQWKGVDHRVTVMADGFEYNGLIYASLSEVARLITGTRWNGPRFFGLRKKSANVIESDSNLNLKPKRVRGSITIRGHTQRPRSAAELFG